MKTRKIITVLMLSALTTGIFAQNRENKTPISEEQKTQLKEVRDKYSPKMKELAQELKYKQAEQDVLLSSEKVNEKAIYANIEEIGKLRLAMQENALAMRAEMKDICPMDGMREFQKQRGPRQMKQGDKDGQGRGNMRAAEGKKGKQEAAKGEPKGNKAQMAQNCEQGPKKGEGPKEGMRQGGKRQGPAIDLNLSEEQKTAIAEIKKEHFWDIQEIQNEIKLLKAKNSSIEDQLASAKEMNALYTELAKEKMAVKLEVREVLSEEQLMKVIAKQGMKDGKGPRQGHKQGPEKGGRRS